MNRIFAIFVFGLMMALAQAGNVYAAPSALTYTVNQTVDEDDATRFDFRCDTRLFSPGDQCSLRAAIQQANYTAGTDTIEIVSSAPHKITRSGDDDNANRGDLDITESVIIEGRAPFTTIDGNGIDRVFHVHTGTVTMRNLIVRGGHTNGFGGGFMIEDAANVSLTNVVVRDNFAADNSGGIENFGALTLNRVTITANTTNDSIGGLASGRASSTSSLAIQNSTIAANQGTEVVVADSATIINSTLDQLNAVGGVSLRNVTVGGLTHCESSLGCGNPALTNLFNSIVSTCGDGGTFSSLGYNLMQTPGACTLSGNQAGNLIGVNPLLGPLQNNGGPTLTRGLLAGSPAIDAGNPSGCVFGNNLPLTADQRGLPRPTDGDGVNGARCDMGAFEVGAVGIGSISPNKGSSNAGDQTMFDLAWDSPTRWRDLNTVDLRFKRGKEILLWLRFTEGLPNSTFSLLDKDGNVVDSGNAGEGKILQNKFGALDLASSGFTASGPNDPHVVLHYAVTFRKKAVGKLETQMLATDDFANAQGPEPGGKWVVEK